MKFEKAGAGIKIAQPDSETIKVVEGSGSAKVIGCIILLGGALLVWNSINKIAGITSIFGVLLMLFGAAIATQRYVMTLDRLKGTWSYGGDVFFLIPYKNRGLLSDLGPVHIGRLATNPREHDMGKPIITYPVSVEARKIAGEKENLRFGQHWSLKEAHEISALLSEFLGNPVKDESNKE